MFTIEQLQEIKRQLDPKNIDNTRVSEEQLQNIITEFSLLSKSAFNELHHTHIKNQIKYGVYTLLNVVRMCLPPVYVISQLIPTLLPKKSSGLEFGPTTVGFPWKIAPSITQEAHISYRALPAFASNPNNMQHLTPSVHVGSGIWLMHVQIQTNVGNMSAIGMSVGFNNKGLMVRHYMNLNSFELGATLSQECFNFTDSTFFCLLPILLAMYQYMYSLTSVVKQLRIDTEDMMLSKQVLDLERDVQSVCKDILSNIEARRNAAAQPAGNTIPYRP